MYPNVTIWHSTNDACQNIQDQQCVPASAHSLRSWRFDVKSCASFQGGPHPWLGGTLGAAQRPRDLYLQVVHSRPNSRRIGCIWWLAAKWPRRTQLTLKWKQRLLANVLFRQLIGKQWSVSNSQSAMVVLHLPHVYTRDLPVNLFAGMHP